VAVVRASFFSNQLCKPQNFAFALSKSFGKLSSLLSPRPTWQTSNPVFSQTYVLRVQPLFSPAETSFTALSFALSIINFFQLRAFAEGYNHKITCCFPHHVLRSVLYFFHRDELCIKRTRQVDFARYNKRSKAPFLRVFGSSSLF
jgi:hypothetical protein